MLADIHERRLKTIPDESLQKWAKNMIKEWSRNEITTMQIIDLAKLYGELTLFDEEIAKTGQFVENSSGSLKAHPALKARDETFKQAQRIIRKLDISPDTVIYGEGYEDE